jgi:Putative zinc-finger
VRCEEYEVWLSAYLDSELAAPEVPLLEDHLAGCQHCALELASLQSGVGLTRALALEEPPEDLKRRIMAAIDATRPSLWSRMALLLRGPALRPALGLSAAGAAALFTVFVAMHRPGATTTRTAATLPPLSAPSRAAAPASAQPLGPDVTIARATPVIHPPAPKRTMDPSSTDRAALSPVRPVDPPQLAARPEPSVDGAVVGAPAVPRVTPAGHMRASGRSYPRSGTGHVTLAERPRARSAPRLAVATRGMTPAPPASTDPYPAGGTTDASPGELVSAASASAGPDPYPEEPVTMMASMPEMPSGTDLDHPSDSNDELAELRQRLAIQRREVPTISVGGGRRSQRSSAQHFGF